MVWTIFQIKEWLINFNLYIYIINLKIYKMEIWKSIEGYEGLYEVSNFGNIKSLERQVLETI